MISSATRKAEIHFPINLSVQVSHRVFNQLSFSTEGTGMMILYPSNNKIILLQFLRPVRSLSSDPIEGQYSAAIMPWRTDICLFSKVSRETVCKHSQQSNTDLRISPLLARELPHTIKPRSHIPRRSWKIAGHYIGRK